MIRRAIEKLLFYMIILNLCACSISLDSHIDFKSITIDNAPNYIIDYAHENKFYETAGVFKTHEYTYIFINRGAKPTAGYDIKVKTLVKQTLKDKTEIIIKLDYIDPSYNEELENIIVFPHVLIETPKIDDSIPVEYRVEKNGIKLSTIDVVINIEEK